MVNHWKEQEIAVSLRCQGIICSLELPMTVGALTSGWHFWVTEALWFPGAWQLSTEITYIRGAPGNATQSLLGHSDPGGSTRLVSWSCLLGRQQDKCDSTSFPSERYLSTELGIAVIRKYKRGMQHSLFHNQRKKHHWLKDNIFPASGSGVKLTRGSSWSPFYFWFNELSTWERTACCPWCHCLPPSSPQSTIRKVGRKEELEGRQLHSPSVNVG